jgi:hypothetical protein
MVWMKWFPPNAEAVAVTAGDDHRELVIRELDPRSHRQRSAMQRVHAVGVDVARQVGRAADAANRHHIVRLDLQLH